MIFEKPRRQTDRSALPSADNVETLKRSCAFALLLCAFPAGELTNLNTTRKEELRAALEHAMEGRAGRGCGRCGGGDGRDFGCA
jgi:hypothetical protein